MNGGHFLQERTNRVGYRHGKILASAVLRDLQYERLIDSARTGSTFLSEIGAMNIYLVPLYRSMRNSGLAGVCYLLADLQVHRARAVGRTRNARDTLRFKNFHPQALH